MTAGQVFIGVDGGTSHTDVFVSDVLGRRYGAGHSGPLNNPRGDGHHPEAVAHLAAAFEDALRAAGLEIAHVQAAWFGLSGASDWLSEDVRSQWTERLSISKHCVVSWADDHLCHWAAALCPDPAIWVLLGTYWGSRAVVGGVEVEHPLDDNDLDVLTAARAEPHWLGSAALSLCVERLVRGEADAFTDAMLSELGVGDLSGLLAWCRAHDARNERAALLPFVARQATGDTALGALLPGRRAAARRRNHDARRVRRCATGQP